MPTFDLVPKPEAELKTASGKRAMIIKEYVEYLNQLQDGHAGRLQPVGGEGIMTVRRRIGAAAKALGKDSRNKALRGRHILLDSRCPPATKRQAQEEP